MSGAIVILGTLDTKGVELQYLRRAIAARGAQPLVVDAGILDAPAFPPDIDRHAVAAAAGSTIEALAGAGDRGQAVTRMAEGAARLVADLYARGQVAAIVGIGGSGNATIAGAAMRALPTGVPKLLVTTVAAGDTRPYIGTTDITMMYSVVDIAGLNRLSRRILGNAAAAIVGMASAEADEPATTDDRPLVAASMFGVTTPCVTAAREGLEALGYEVLVFHATGVGGRSMETLIRDGFFAGALDVTTTELADEVAGGTLSAGPDRLEAAGRAGIPQVVSLGALDMANFGPLDTIPERLRGRLLYQHNPAVTLMRTTREENAALGLLIAAKLNRARGPVALVVPRRGISMIDAPGAPFFDPAADAALFDALRAGLEQHVELVEVDAHINDPAFATVLVETFHRLFMEGAR
ncbi:MAG TPA: Tm-1-like ATP-binding domain-containing protein [Chloroflexota bacterium]|nr:Tm-1-like ATP-binding domain-containing protein [Chloroflexota bacterium]